MAIVVIRSRDVGTDAAASLRLPRYGSGVTVIAGVQRRYGGSFDGSIKVRVDRHLGVLCWVGYLDKASGPACHPPGTCVSLNLYIRVLSFIRSKHGFLTSPSHLSPRIFTSGL